MTPSLAPRWASHHVQDEFRPGLGWIWWFLMKILGREKFVPSLVSCSGWPNLDLKVVIDFWFIPLVETPFNVRISTPPLGVLLSSSWRRSRFEHSGYQELYNGDTDLVSNDRGFWIYLFYVIIVHDLGPSFTKKSLLTEIMHIKITGLSIVNGHFEYWPLQGSSSLKASSWHCNAY